MSDKNKTLAKCDELIQKLNELKKAVDPNTKMSSTIKPKTPSLFGDNEPKQAQNLATPKKKPAPALGTGWQSDERGQFHHLHHGIITTTPHEEGGFFVKHVPRQQELRPMHKRTDTLYKWVPDLQAAGKLIREYTNGLKAHNYSLSDAPDRITKSNYTPAQLAAIEEADHLKKNCTDAPWVQHKSVPNGDEEVKRIQRVNPPVVAENLMANQLANMMAGKSMLGMTPPRQPTDEEMFGHLIPSEEMIKSAEQNWSGGINNWLAEAQKPIASRFSSEEEEQAFWDNIKVADKDDGRPGY